MHFLLRFILAYYAAFGLTATLKFATRPDVRIGDDALWDRAESALKAALDGDGHAVRAQARRRRVLRPQDRLRRHRLASAAPGSSARSSSTTTRPERFDLTYVGEDNTAHRPVVIHRAVSGSLERFIAILIEHFAGAFPVWLAPEQVRVLPITDDYREYADQVTKRLHDAGVRVHLDARSETLKYRVAEGARMKVPYMVVVGKREAEQGTVAVNVRGAGEKQKPNSLPLDEFVTEGSLSSHGGFNCLAGRAILVPFALLKGPQDDDLRPILVMRSGFLRMTSFSNPPGSP